MIMNLVVRARVSTKILDSLKLMWTSPGLESFFFFYMELKFFKRVTYSSLLEVNLSPSPKELSSSSSGVI